MAMKPYSDIIVYDERKKYYYVRPRFNKPLLDDEVKNLQLSIVDQLRRSIQSTYGDVGSPLVINSDLNPTSNAFKIVQATVTNNNFTITGGTSIEHPAVLFIKGYYVFLSGNFDYTDQNDLGDITDDYFTETAIPDLTTPTADRIDIVYVDLHFEEVSSNVGPYQTTYTDTNLRNPIVGTETANRLRAVADIRVWEDYLHIGTLGPISSGIFDSLDFLGSINPFDPSIDPVYAQHFKVPIAAIYRTTGVSAIVDSDIVDLLDLYNKRVLSLEELSYMATHGGYTSKEVGENGLTGFVHSFPAAIIDETAGATGLNEGFGSEAFNSGSVTPRILNSDGKFNVGALLVGKETGTTTYPITAETGAEQLELGEGVANHLSAKSVYIGYDRGVTGVREYKDRLNIQMQGITGDAGLSIINKTGETGSKTVVIDAGVSGSYNMIVVDYLGRMGLGVTEPGWNPPQSTWNTTNENIVLDVSESVRVGKDLFVDRDQYTEGNIFGTSWQIPSNVSPTTPAIFGLTGYSNLINGAVPTYNPLNGITGKASMYVFPGIAVIGLSGVQGYTGDYGFFESFSSTGERAFTIGSFGKDFDRKISTVYGQGNKALYYTEDSILYINGDGVYNGDIVYYSGTDTTGDSVSDSFTFTGIGGMTGTVGLTGVYLLTQDMVSPSHFTDTEAQILEPPFITDPLDANHDIGKFIITDTSSSGQSFFTLDSLIVEINHVAIPDITVDVIRSQWYGTPQFGGAELGIKLVKMDLGEGADGWLFNGDVFFNGTGLLNRVTFSPKVMFRGDAFFYGNLVAYNTQIGYLNATSINTYDLDVSDLLTVEKGAAIGFSSRADGLNDLASLSGLSLSVYNTIKAQELILRPLITDPDTYKYGTLILSGRNGNIGLKINGSSTTGATTPIGLHIVDVRSTSLKTLNPANILTIDYSDGRGNYSDILINVNGDLTVSDAIVAKYVTISDTLTEANKDYKLYVDGRTRINGILEVEEIDLVGTTGAGTATDIIDPTDVSIVVNGNYTIHPGEHDRIQVNPDILRNKRFTVVNKFNLNNYGTLGGDYDGIVSPSYRGRFANDTLSYTEDIFNSNSLSPSTPVSSIVAADFTNSAVKKEFRRNFDRITLATLGTLNIDWLGYYLTSAYTISNIAEAVQGGNGGYTFDSPYLKSRFTGANSINWLTNSTSYSNLDTNYISKIQGYLSSALNISPYSNLLYKFDNALLLFIDMNNWDIRRIDYTNPEDVPQEFSTIAIYYQYAKTAVDLNRFIIANPVPAGGIPEVLEIALYPTLVSQTYVNLNNSNTAKVYNGVWNIDIVMYPVSTGNISNFIGDMYISNV